MMPSFLIIIRLVSFVLGPKQNVKDVLKGFSPQLVEVLPMQDTTFITELDAALLFPGNVKATIQSLPTTADKASYFIDNVILCNVGSDRTNLNKLLTVMEKFNYDPAKNLAEKIRTALN